ESFGLLYDKVGARRADFPNPGPKSSAAPIAPAIGAPAPSRFVFPYDVDANAPSNILTSPGPTTVNSTYPWMEWDNRPYVSADELLNVAMASQSRIMRTYSMIDPNVQPANRRNPYGLASVAATTPSLGSAQVPVPNSLRWTVMPAPFGSLANVFAA